MGFSWNFIWLLGLRDIINYISAYFLAKDADYTHTSAAIFSLLRKLQKEFYIWLEISLQDIKWVSNIISFGFLVWEISSIISQHIFEPRRPTMPTIPWPFSPYSRNFRTISTHGLKYLFNFSNGYMMESHFPSWFERYHQLYFIVFLSQWGQTYPYFRGHFLPAQEISKGAPHMAGNISSISQMVFGGIQFHRLQQKLWINF